MLTMLIPTVATYSGTGNTSGGPIRFASWERLFRVLGQSSISHAPLKRLTWDILACVSRLGQRDLEVDLLMSSALLVPPGERRNPFAMLKSAPAASIAHSSRLLVLRPRVGEYSGLLGEAESILARRVQFYSRLETAAGGDEEPRNSPHTRNDWQQAIHLFDAVVVQPDVCGAALCGPFLPCREVCTRRWVRLSRSVS
jgi:hypothetical protein